VKSLAYALALRNFGIAARDGDDSLNAFLKANFVLELMGLQNTEDFKVIGGRIELLRSRKELEPMKE
jgi:hypothetical protein